jgi:hypothetical protein
MNTGNEVVLSPMAICSSVNDSVSEGIFAECSAIFRPLSPSYHEVFVTYCVLEWCVKWKWFEDRAGLCSSSQVIAPCGN